VEKHRAIYPGSFDPITYGHIDLVKRALLLFDEIIVVVGINVGKSALFSVEERVEFVRKSFEGIKGVIIDSNDGLTVEYAKKKKARSIIRGLRATSDFDYEFQMALTNRKLSKEVDTVFLMPSESHFYISSKLIKEIAILKGDVTEYVPNHVADEIVKRYASLS
jgi:pantetheine-phosphate adenylyltransferase